jgi:DNA-binding XRE family transcriptional regulator
MPTQQAIRAPQRPQQITEARKRCGLTQAKLAELVGV